jgi:hypothetical protein
LLGAMPFLLAVNDAAGNAIGVDARNRNCEYGVEQQQRR